MKKRILGIPLLVIIIFILVGVGGVTAAVLIGGGGASNEEVSLQKGLVGHWKFNGNAKDSSPYANNGTLNGDAVITAADRKGQTNSAVSFNGTGYVNVPDADSLDMSSNVTVSAWVKLTDVTDSRQIVNKNNDGNGFNEPYYFAVLATSGLLHGRFGNGSTNNTITSTRAVNDGTWHHVVFAYDTAFSYLYVDGTSDATPVAKTIIPVINTTALMIGSWNNVWNKYVGQIDDVRIYNRAISQAEITALYQSYDPGIVVSDLQKGLVGQWKMDGNAKDSTANSNHGTVTGAALTTDRKGQTNKAYSFDGVDDYVDAGNAASLNITSAITLSAWAKADTLTSSGDGIVYKPNVWGLDVKSDGAIRSAFYTSVNGVLTAYDSNAGEIVIGTWYYIVATYDGANVRIYKNGVEVKNFALTGAIQTSANNLKIGEEVSSTYNFDGSIDEVRIYNRALSQTEITASYESYNPGIVISDLQKGLVGQWKMDGNAKDSTANSNHGTVTGATLVNDRKGQALKAYSFDGVDDYVDAGSGASLSLTTAITAEAWVNLKTTPAGYDGVVHKNSETPNLGWLLYFNINTTNPYFQIYNSGSVGAAVGFDGGIGLGNWSHIVGTYDGTVIKIYVNGVERGSTSKVGDIGVGASNSLIGVNGTQYIDGLIDEVRVYNRALTQTEVTALYESY